MNYSNMPEYSYLIGFVVAVLFAGVVGCIADAIANSLRDTDKE